jgi:iron complex transport system ATP-binding protein
MLQANHIFYQIGDKKILEDVSFTFETGKLNLIIGANGAGKSSLVKILAKQIPLTQGNVFFGEKNLNKLTTLQLSRVRAVLSQNIDLAFPLTVAQVVMMGRYPHFINAPTEKDKVACWEAMSFFGLLDMAERNFMTLSGGEKQRTHFARVIAQIWYPIEGEQRYLILDEPLTFLDIYYQFDFMYKIISLLKQKDIVIAGVIHDLNLAARFADNLLLLHHGKVLASGSKESVFTPENIKIAYQMDVNIRYENDIMQLFF